MQLVEIALFAAVAALALTLIGYAVRPYLRAKRRPAADEAIADARAGAEGARAAPAGHGLPRLPPRLRPGAAVLPPRRARSGSGQRSGGPGRGVRAPPARPASAPTTPARGSARSTARSWFRCRSRWVRAIRPAPSPSLSRRAGEDLPQLLAPVRERGHLLRARRRGAGSRQLRSFFVGAASVTRAPRPRLLDCSMRSSFVNGRRLNGPLSVLVGVLAGAAIGAGCHRARSAHRPGCCRRAGDDRGAQGWALALHLCRAGRHLRHHRQAGDDPGGRARAWCG